MLRSILIGLVAGFRCVIPVASVAGAAVSKRLPKGNGLGRVFGIKPVAAGAPALAGEEWRFDLNPSAPNRMSPVDLACRVTTASYAGAALSEAKPRWIAGALAGLVAVPSTFATFRLRALAQKRFGLETAAIGEDLIAASTALLIVWFVGARTNVGSHR